jgi:sugar/nucleoside kinase (ribokinase family)
MSILVVGDANADLSAGVSRYPAEGDDTRVNSLEWGSGGSAANTAAALGRLGAPARLLARVGPDPAAEVALRIARDSGADMSLVQVDGALATGLCYAAVSPGGERTFFSFRGANVELRPIGAEQLAGASWLHVSAYALLEGRQRASTLALIELALSSGIPTSLDLSLLGLRAARAEIAGMLPLLAVLFANEQELAELCPGLSQPDAADELIRQGLALATIKLGPAGALIAGPGLRLRAPAFEVAAVDSSGCGDAFVAGFLAAHLRGAPVEQCCGLANALGALTATRYGAADALPTRAELRDFLLARVGYQAEAELLEG